jgi:hypothetical protein
MQRVYLPPTAPAGYADSSAEAQYVTAKRPISGGVYISSQDTPYGTDRTKCQVGGSNILASNANRMRMLGVAVIWNIPNVNPRNNSLSFFSSVTGLVHDVTLTEAYYDITVPADIAALMVDIVGALNSAGSGLSFSSTPAVGFPRKFVITAVGGLFYFVTTSDAVAKGEQMYLFQREGRVPVPAASKTVGPMNLIYTMFVDIKSTVLTKWAKIKSMTTGNQNPVVMRAYVGGNKWGYDFQELHDYLAFAWKWSEPIYSIDFSFFDQNGDPLYAPNGGKDFIWQISLEAEL